LIDWSRTSCQKESTEAKQKSLTYYHRAVLKGKNLPTMPAGFY